MTDLILFKPDKTSALPALLKALEVRVVMADTSGQDRLDGTALIVSEAGLVDLDRVADGRGCSITDLLPSAGNVLIYPFVGTEQGLRALKRMTGSQVSVAEPKSSADYLVTDNRELCGAFCGLKVKRVQSGMDRPLTVSSASSTATAIVGNERGNLLTEFRTPQTAVFVLATEAIFDPSLVHTRNLQVAECFSGLAPLLFFLRRCGARPQNSFRWAHWVIDDPGLKPRYGFLNMAELDRAIRDSDAAASIAFIPWNHKRTSPRIVDLFRRSWPQLSICVHGCDHTGSEFSTRTLSQARKLVNLAMERMNAMAKKTSLTFERIIVFPQGEFSGEAMRALRQSEMVAAVNTELLDCQTKDGVRGEELLKPAVLSFGGFPLFMRRKAEDDLAEFALDLLLDKPCLIVTHHQYFEGGLEQLRSKVRALRSLQPDMTWTNLEKGIAGTYSRSASSNRESTIRLYSTRTAVEPCNGDVLLFRKRETEPDGVQVFVNSEPVPFSFADGDITFSVKTNSNAPLKVDILGIADKSVPVESHSAKYRIKVAARRYLTEWRDNYLSKLQRISRTA